jgi:hypothetical protein
MSVLVVHGFPETASISSSSGRTPWLYLGKDVRKREAAARLLGDKDLVPLGDRLHVVAERLRQPFLDFVAAVGMRQPDQVGWWASSCSWKLCTGSDLFLLICYDRLAAEFIQEWVGGSRTLILVIEDPWLFCHLKDTCGKSSDVRFQGRPLLWVICIEATLRGLAARAFWAMRLAWSLLKQSWFGWRGRQSAAAGPVISIYSHPQARSMSGREGWIDPYLGDLDRILEQSGYSVQRFSFPPILEKEAWFERELAQRSRYFHPLILFLTAAGFLRALVQSWPRTVLPQNPEIGKRSVSRLLARERWVERRGAARFIYRVFFECAKEFFAREPVQAVIYPYENHPLEKMLVLAARDSGVATIGYQHGGGVPPFMLSYFYGQGEAKWAPLPDAIMTSDSYAHKALAEGGTPTERLRMGGNLRRPEISSGHAMCSHDPGAGNRVLVALPIDSTLSAHLLQALKKAFPDGGLAEGIEFVVKPHPLTRLDERSLDWPAAMAAGTLEESLGRSAVMIYSWSYVGLTALAMGRRVVRYKPELLLNLVKEPPQLLEEGRIVECGDGNIRTTIMAALREASGSRISNALSQDFLDRLFPAVDNGVWLRTVQSLIQPAAQAGSR